MSLFDKNNLSANPVTAQGLREIIKSRYSLKGDTLEDICDKLLTKIYRTVEYSLNEDKYSYKTSLAALQLQSPLSQQGAARLNTFAGEYIVNEKEINKIIDEMGDEFWGEEFKKSVEFFKSRGFSIFFDMPEFCRLCTNEDRIKSRLITISWEESD